MKKNLIKTYDKNIFYHILLDSYLFDYKTPSPETKITFCSQIFQKTNIEVIITESTISEDDNYIYRRKVGKPILEKLDLKELNRQYKLFYKPLIQYNFTEYNYIYRLSYKIDKKTGFITEFNLKQISL